jgi:hypothetical protein
MTTNSNQEKSKDIEIDLIISDAYFYDELMRLISSKQSNGILIFGIIPYISLFTIESYTYIKKVLPHHLRNLSKDNEKIIRNARMRLNFFDDSNNKVDGTFYLLDEISEFLKDWFINSHKGSLASIRKKMQPDMGISFCGNHTALVITVRDSRILSLPYLPFRFCPRWISKTLYCRLYSYRIVVKWLGKTANIRRI